MNRLAAFGVMFAVLGVAGCTEGSSSAQSEVAQGNVEAQQDQPAPVAEANPISGSREEESALELERISANVWGVLSGDYACVDKLSSTPTCIETSDSRQPSSGSKFLDVEIEVRNTGEAPQTLDAAGDLIASLRGKDYRYSPIEQKASTSIEVQPLASGVMHAYYEVPVTVLNEADFKLSIKGGQASFVFETPAKQAEGREARRAESQKAEEDRKAQKVEEQARYDRCWALNDHGTPMVTRDEFAWYVENCSHLFNVGDYETYVSVRQHQG